ncbi:MAG TPA: hypothetical protein VHJ78_11910 [Actinomycetota bacterium]|nr:hypothetical protein [Actinomycetota bacterium]
MKARIAAVLVGATMSIAAPTAAWADAPANDNNCAGAFVSDLTPAFVAGDPGSFGEAKSEEAQTGTVGKTERALTGQLASCGVERGS